MASQVKDIIQDAREILVEKTARFWSDEELIRHCAKGVKDLWRDTVNLKQEHYLYRNTTDVSYPANSDQLTGVPLDVHKLYLIEPRDVSSNSNDRGLLFKPLDYNHPRFQMARSLDAMDPVNNVIYYCITSAGAPVNAPIIYVAPKVTSAVPLSFVYVPTLEPITTLEAAIPIPGEADAALVAWVVAYARAKETDSRTPDSGWLSIYSSEKQHLLQALGAREYQEPLTVDAMFEDYF